MTEFQMNRKTRIFIVLVPLAIFTSACSITITRNYQYGYPKSNETKPVINETNTSMHILRNENKTK
jgi:hypothetical protein